MKNSDYLKNKLKSNTNTIDPNQDNDVDRMRITGDEKTLIFCVSYTLKGRSLSFYLSTTALLHPQPPPPFTRPRLNLTQPKHFCHLRCWFFSESKVGNTQLFVHETIFCNVHCPFFREHFLS